MNEDTDKRTKALELAAPEGSAAWWFVVGFRTCEEDVRYGRYAALHEILQEYARIVGGLANKREAK